MTRIKAASLADMLKTQRYDLYELATILYALRFTAEDDGLAEAAADKVYMLAEIQRMGREDTVRLAA